MKVGRSHQNARNMEFMFMVFSFRMLRRTFHSYFCFIFIHDRQRQQATAKQIHTHAHCFAFNILFFLSLIDRFCGRGIDMNDMEYA